MHTIKILPHEILTMICDELGRQRDFSTLYRCALSDVSFADPAIRNLYYYHDKSPAFCQVADQEALFPKWTLLWRSIIRSSLDKTYRPYCRYLRTLDFRNLTNLFDDSRFKGQAQRHLIDGDIESLFECSCYFIRPTLPNSKTRMSKRLYYRDVDISTSIETIGEAVTQKTVLLEELSGHLSRDSLSRWIARSSRLQSLVLWQGDALEQGAAEAIRENCPSFKSLTIYEWTADDSDRNLARFLGGLNENTIEYFEIISYSRIAGLSLNALGHHANSLKDLRLSNLSPEAIQCLGQLRDCTNIEKLYLMDNSGVVRLEDSEYDVFLEIISWLSACTKLRDITLKKFHDGPSILSEVLSSSAVRITKLSLEGYKVWQEHSDAFHISLSEQIELQSITLKGNGEDAHPDDLTIMVDSLCHLENLTELILKDVSDEFGDSHIMQLAHHLPLLQDFWTSGTDVTEDVLAPLANLKLLKSLTFYAITQFSAESIIDFISSLDKHSQKGFSLSLMAADSDYDLGEEEQALIREMLKTELEGKFDFVVWREADHDSESDSD